MDKIRELLVKNGLEESVAESISQQLVEYKQNARQELETEYAAKLATAKKACLEETEAYKRDLARRLQIFCEAKGPAIEATIAKQAAIGDTEAKRQLQGVKDLLEGIAPSTTGGNQATIINLKKQLKAVTEARDKAIEKANRSNAIAEKALQRSRLLESKQQRLAESAAVAPRTARKSAQPVTTRQTLAENQTRQVPPVKTQPRSDIEFIANTIVD